MKTLVLTKGSVFVCVCVCVCVCVFVCLFVLLKLPSISTIMRTSMQIEGTEFEEFSIAQPTSVTFPLKEIKAIVALLEFFSEVRDLFFC